MAHLIQAIDTIENVTRYAVHYTTETAVVEVTSRLEKNRRRTKKGACGGDQTIGSTQAGSSMSRYHWLFCLIGAVILTSGCTVGPDYRRPEPAVPPAWQTAEQDGIKKSRIAPAQLAAWWQVLNDPLLSRLVKEADTNNLDLKLAAARLQEARARRGYTAADRYPSLQAGAGASRIGSSEETGSGKTSDSFGIQFDASWEIDLFGKKRRSLEAATSTAEAALEDLRATRVSLLAEVVLTYIELRSYQAQLAILEANISSQAETWQIASWRNRSGLVTQLDEDQARMSLEQTRSLLPTLHGSLEQTRNSLAVLLGRQPGTLPELTSAAPLPLAPAELAIGVPADTLRQRPDIRSAERRLAAATAQIGVATAARYPALSLSGSVGLQAMAVDNLFQPGAMLYSLAANTVMTIFDSGRIRQNIEIQNAVQEQAKLQYQSSVLTALRDVENSLIAYAQELNRRQALTQAVQAAQSAAGIAGSQYRAGLVDFPSVLETQRSLLSVQEQLVRCEAAVVSNLARLYKALGGGWSQTEPDQTDRSGATR